MPTFEIEGADGKVFEVEAPDHARAVAAFRKFTANEGGPEPQREATSEQQAVYDETRRRLEAAPRMSSDLVTDWLPFKDEVTGAANFLGTLATTGSLLKAGDAYAAGRAAEQDMAAERSADRGVIGNVLGAVGAGALATPANAAASLTGQAARFGGQLFATPAATTLGRVGQAAGTGATMGALYGASEGNGMLDRARNAAIGAGVGGALSGALQGVGEGVGGMLARRAATRANQQRAAQAATDQAAEFGIPLSRGQALPEGPERRAAQAFEQDIARRADGSMATRIASRAREAQANALARSVDRVEQRIAPDVAGASISEDAAIVGQTLRDLANHRRVSASALFDALEERPVTLASQAAPSLRQRMASRISDMGMGEDAFAKSILRRVNTINENARRGAIPFGELRKLRVDLNARGQARTDTGFMARELKGVWDDWLKTALESQWIQGDTRVVDTLREANNLWRQYRGMVPARSGDVPAGGTLRRIAEGTISDSDLATKLFTGTKSEALNLARVIQRETPEALDNVRAGVLRRLVMNPSETSPRAVRRAADDIDGLLNKGGEWVDIVFSAEHQAVLRRYADTLRRLAADADLYAPSAPGVMRALGARADAAFGAALGSIFGPVGAGAGAVVAPAVTTARTTMRANTLFNRPVPRGPMLSWNIPQTPVAGVAGGMLGGMNADSMLAGGGGY